MRISKIILLIAVALNIAIGTMTALAAAPVEDYSLNASEETGSNSSNSIAAASTNYAVTEKPVATPVATEQRLQRLEQQVNYINKNDVSQHLADIQQKLQKLSGDLEEQQHRLEQLQKQLNDFYADLDQRIKSNNASNKASITNKKESGMSDGLSKVSTPIAAHSKPAMLGKAAPSIGKASNKAHKREIKKNDETISSTPRVKDTEDDIAVVKNVDSKGGDAVSKQEDALKEQQSYQEAFNDVQNRAFDNAAKKLKFYLSAYPNSVNAGNAHYWLGEIYFMKNSYAKAGSEFDSFVKKYPHSPKVPTARFKLAYIHAQEGKSEQAQQEYLYIKKHFPNSAAAKLAEDQLASGGH